MSLCRHVITPSVPGTTTTVLVRVLMDAWCNFSRSLPLSTFHSKILEVLSQFLSRNHSTGTTTNVWWQTLEFVPQLYYNIHRGRINLILEGISNLRVRSHHRLYVPENPPPHDAVVPPLIFFKKFSSLNIPKMEIQNAHLLSAHHCPSCN